MTDPIATKLNELVGSEELYVELLAFDELDDGMRALVGTWELTSEVCNGGFMQYFHNSSGEHAVTMIAVLRAYGATEIAAILEEAIKLAGPGSVGFVQGKYIEALQSTSSEVKNRLGELERRFEDQSDDMHLRLYRYLAQRRDQIPAPDEFWTEATIQ
jgi:Domain of unknown function (DUF4375)